MMKFRKLMLASAISSALLLAGCGGAGSDSEKILLQAVQPPVARPQGQRSH